MYCNTSCDNYFGKVHFLYTLCRKSALYTHVFALLHALVAVTTTWFPERSSMSEDPEATEVLPVTSYMSVNGNLNVKKGEQFEDIRDKF